MSHMFALQGDESLYVNISYLVEGSPKTPV
jgi:hypothetical protein